MIESLFYFIENIFIVLKYSKINVCKGSESGQVGDEGTVIEKYHHLKIQKKCLRWIIAEYCE